MLKSANFFGIDRFSSFWRLETRTTILWFNVHKMFTKSTSKHRFFETNSSWAYRGKSNLLIPNVWYILHQIANWTRSRNWARVRLKTSQRGFLLMEPIHLVRQDQLNRSLNALKAKVWLPDNPKSLETVLKMQTPNAIATGTQFFKRFICRIQVPIRIRFLENFLAVKSFAIRLSSA